MVVRNSKSSSGRAPLSLSAVLFGLAKASVSIALLVWLTWRIDSTHLVDRFSRLSLALACAVVGLGVLQNLVFGVRWQQVLKASGFRMGLGSSVRLAFIGLLFNQALPATVGGDAVRIYYATREGVPFRVSWTSVLFDRVLALVAVLALLVVSLPLLFGLIVDSRLVWPVVLVAASGLAAFAAFIVLWAQLRGLLSGFRLIAPLARLADDFYLLVRCRTLPAIGILAVSVHLISAAMMSVSALALGLDLSIGAALALTPPITVVAMLPISFAGWGVREGAMVAGLATVGIGSDAAIAVSVLFGLSQLTASLPGGLLWLLAQPDGEALPADWAGSKS